MIEWWTLTWHKPIDSTPTPRPENHFPVAFFPKSSAWRHGIHGEKTTVAMWISTNPIIPITQHRLPDGHFCLLPLGNFAEVSMQRCHFTKGSNEISDLEA